MVPGMESDAQARALRAAGQHARSHAVQLAGRLLVLICACILVLALAGPVFGLTGPALILVELAAIGLMLLAYRRLDPVIDRWHRGAEGEEAVGAILEELSGQGWNAIHDVSLGRGNVDHIAIGPGGVFTIETKSHRGRRSVDRIDRDMLKQAYAQKKLLERITGLEVEPLLVFTQAWLVGSVPTRQRGVVILPGRMLAGYLARREPTIHPERASQIYEQLAAALSGAASGA